MVRSMPAAGGEVDEERLVGRVGLVLLQPADGVVGQVLGQVIARRVGRLDDVGVFHQARLPLAGFAGEEAVEILEAIAGRPFVEGTHRRRLVGRRVVPFAEGGRLVAVVLQHFGDGSRSLRDHAGVAVPIHSALGDGSAADALVIAPGQQRGPGRRTDRGIVESVIADAGLRNARQIGRIDLATVGAGLPVADIVDQDDQDVRRILRQMVGLGAPMMNRGLQCRAGLAR
jgi:hypothetical protein